jgi:hypothetical protein
MFFPQSVSVMVAFSIPSGSEPPPTLAVIAASERVKKSQRGSEDTLPSAENFLPFDPVSLSIVRREFATSRCGNCVK